MPRDSARTKQLLLEAAHAEFAEHGIAGARVDRIAAAAGCNKERIYGHFGNKEALFSAVLANAMLGLADTVKPGESSTADLVRRVFDYHRADPSLLRLLMFEALYYGDTLADSNVHRRDWYTQVKATLVERTGLPEQDIGRTLLTLVGLGAWPIAMPQLVRLFLGDSASTDDNMAGLREFLAAFADRAADLP
ncbi:TetR/AcrR family transcriptional regulator [Nocardia cyriacigeorgica]|jgi:AcrR family transcriptional regulator|uniref:TetR/AcrR family transcriptional regulator n=1 Tax=Nocardia cyriacigeorgica TaxID=135487 RepID=UPI000CE9CE80|nr:TetR/AcrR family transcriptional regulator [Nocardia cyriacigeorgica]AVH21579.1 TetR/AcrR family transcriptional regulator [Nocardia cyriacigeorgica]MBF6321036.1 TetR/AcrR family transcriptional regulator [Nocardia cyriacigeorgica]MBF6495269.1 TetR/AcrR family transcriptional regulator [Nocardia cyriacigeorgica]PPJ12443.1 TetR/AcrR family transcriptional regulator [Nocardia cyriacigeorgica]